MYKLRQVCRAMDTEEALLLHLCRQMTSTLALQMIVDLSDHDQSNRRSG
jgi:hypothetical protein